MKILFISLNPSIGTTIFTESNIVSGSINRTPLRSVDWANGKTLIASRAFRLLGGDAESIFFMGGDTGEKLSKMLKGVIRFKTVPIAGEIRRTFCLTEGKKETHLLEVGPTISKRELSEMAAAVSDALPEIDTICISGSLPAGISGAEFSDFLSLFSNKVKIILDVSGEALTHAAKHADILKINQEEFLNGFCSNQIELDLFDEISNVARIHNIDSLIVTQGEAGCVAYFGGRFYRTISPDVEVCSTVGSGDCFLAGLLHKWDGGFEEALRFATACGTANATTKVPGDFDPSTVPVLTHKTKLELIDHEF